MPAYPSCKPWLPLRLTRSSSKASALAASTRKSSLMSAPRLQTPTRIRRFDQMFLQMSSKNFATSRSACSSLNFRPSECRTSPTNPCPCRLQECVQQERSMITAFRFKKSTRFSCHLTHRTCAPRQRWTTRFLKKLTLISLNIDPPTASGSFGSRHANPICPGSLSFFRFSFRLSRSLDR